MKIRFGPNSLNISFGDGSTEKEPPRNYCGTVMFIRLNLFACESLRTFF
jgi:hypothetical protein